MDQFRIQELPHFPTTAKSHWTRVKKCFARADSDSTWNLTPPRVGRLSTPETLDNNFPHRRGHFGLNSWNRSPTEPSLAPSLLYQCGSKEVSWGISVQEAVGIIPDPKLLQHHSRLTAVRVCPRRGGGEFPSPTPLLLFGNGVPSEGGLTYRVGAQTLHDSQQLATIQNVATLVFQ